MELRLARRTTNAAYWIHTTWSRLCEAAGSTGGVSGGNWDSMETWTPNQRTQDIHWEHTNTG